MKPPPLEVELTKLTKDRRAAHQANLHWRRTARS